MKTLLILTAALLSVTAHAGTGDVGTAEYKLARVDQRSGANLCPENIKIIQSQNSVVIEGVTDLADQFNVNQSMSLGDIGKLFITEINMGPKKDVHRTFAHGERISSTSEAKLDKNVLTVSHTTKFGTLFRSVAKGQLVIAFESNGVTLNVERSYDEAFSKSADWNGSQTCKYSRIR
jgi:hypothetical protein